MTTYTQSGPIILLLGVMLSSCTTECLHLQEGDHFGQPISAFGLVLKGGRQRSRLEGDYSPLDPPDANLSLNLNFRPHSRSPWTEYGQEQSSRGGGRDRGRRREASNSAPGAKHIIEETNERWMERTMTTTTTCAAFPHLRHIHPSALPSICGTRHGRLVQGIQEEEEAALDVGSSSARPTLFARLTPSRRPRGAGD